MKKQGYYGMTLLYKHFKPLLKSKNAFKEAIADFYINNRDQIHLNEVVKKFLLKSNYPLVITTSPCDIIEKDLNYNTSIFYDSQIGSDEEIIESNHCVYHLFGPKKKKKETYLTRLEKGNYVTNEDELLDFLHAINKTQPTALTNYLNDKSLLVLGCCLPNWFFRFLLYPIHNSGDVYLINSEVTSEKLDYYLYLVGYNKSCHIDRILKKLIDKIDLETEESYENAVFLSIASDDEECASKFKEMMESEFNIKVWMYTKENISGIWPRKIENEFKKSKFFMPFVTEKYLDKFLGTERLNGKISALEKCIKEYAIPRIETEDKNGNDDFVLPILKTGVKRKKEDVTPEKLTEWANVDYCSFPAFFSERQCFMYTEKKDSFSIKDCLDINGYETLKQLFLNK